MRLLRSSPTHNPPNLSKLDSSNPPPNTFVSCIHPASPAFLLVHARRHIPRLSSASVVITAAHRPSAPKSNPVCVGRSPCFVFAREPPSNHLRGPTATSPVLEVSDFHPAVPCDQALRAQVNPPLSSPRFCLMSSRSTVRGFMAPPTWTIAATSSSPPSSESLPYHPICLISNMTVSLTSEQSILTSALLVHRNSSPTALSVLRPKHREPHTYNVPSVGTHHDQSPIISSPRRRRRSPARKDCSHG